MNFKKLKIDFVKFYYKYFFWITKYWYSLTMILTYKKKVFLQRHKSYSSIIEALDWGHSYKPDPLNGIIDYMAHPTKIQKNINEKKPIDDCDGHAIYWIASLLYGNLEPAENLNLGTVFYEKADGSLEGHAICVIHDEFFKKTKWCDYSLPQEVEFDEFGWVEGVSKKYSMKPIAASLTKVKKLNKTGRPIFDKQKIKIFDLDT